MKKVIQIGILILTILSLAVYAAVDWTPFGDINLQNFFDLKNVNTFETNVNATTYNGTFHFVCLDDDTCRNTWPAGGGGGTYILNITNGSIEIAITDSEILSILGGSGINVGVAGNAVTITSTVQDTSSQVDALNATQIQLILENISINARADFLNATQIQLILANISTNLRIDSINLTVENNVVLISAINSTAEGNTVLILAVNSTAEANALEIIDLNAGLDDANATAEGKASPGNCPAGQVVMNTTTAGVQCVPIPTGGGSGGDNRTYYFNKTSTLYNGSLTFGSLIGYEAADAICNALDTGTHLCSTQEIFNTITYKNVSTIESWDMSPSTGFAIIRTGGPKFAPATVPFADCQGFLTGDNTQGNNFLIFNNSETALIAAGTCGTPNEKSLACCKSW